MIFMFLIELVVFNKPSSIPIHACGRYRHNTLTFIATKENPQIKNLYIIHRLDRLTSGLLIMGRSREIAAKYFAKMKERKMKKKYLALVKGKFPE